MPAVSDALKRNNSVFTSCFYLVHSNLWIKNNSALDKSKLTDRVLFSKPKLLNNFIPRYWWWIIVSELLPTCDFYSKRPYSRASCYFFHRNFFHVNQCFDLWSLSSVQFIVNLNKKVLKESSLFFFFKLKPEKYIVHWMCCIYEKILINICIFILRY